MYALEMVISNLFQALQPSNQAWCGEELTHEPLQLFLIAKVLLPQIITQGSRNIVALCVNVAFAVERVDESAKSLSLLIASKLGSQLSF